MPNRHPAVQRGLERGQQLRREIGRELRAGRRGAGLSQARVARLVGRSQSLVSRIERARTDPGLMTLCTVAAVVGSDLALRLYPSGPAVRDIAHARLLARLQRRMPATYRWRAEVPLPRVGDLRAIDAVIVVPRLDAGFEIESRLLDAQALARRTLLKQRDAGLGCMVLVLADTPANREALAVAEATLRSAFPLEGRRVLLALREGRTPDQNGIVFV